MDTILGLFVKLPIPGQVKTRLGAEIGMESAAILADWFQRELLRRTVGIASRRVIAFTPDTDDARDWYRPMLQSGDQLWPQPNGDLGIRLKCFFAEFGRDGDHALVIGSDSPDLPVDSLRDGFLALSHADLVIGPAFDGGYYLIGQSRFVGEVFDGIPWSCSTTTSATLETARNLGLTMAQLPGWYDIDTLEDLQRLGKNLAESEGDDDGISHPFRVEVQRILDQVPDFSDRSTEN